MCHRTLSSSVGVDLGVDCPLQGNAVAQPNSRALPAFRSLAILSDALTYEHANGTLALQNVIVVFRDENSSYVAAALASAPLPGRSKRLHVAICSVALH